jgi:hypothetical protein
MVDEWSANYQRKDRSERMTKYSDEFLAWSERTGFPWMEQVCIDHNMKDRAKALLAFRVTKLFEHQVTFDDAPGILTELAEDSHISTKRARRIIGQMIERGHLEVTGDRYRPILRRVKVDVSAETMKWEVDHGDGIIVCDTNAEAWQVADELEGARD